MIREFGGFPDRLIAEWLSQCENELGFIRVTTSVSLVPATQAPPDQEINKARARMLNLQPTQLVNFVVTKADDVDPR